MWIVVSVRDLLGLIQSVLPKWSGQETIKSLVAQKIKEFAALMERDKCSGNSRNTVTGSIACHFRLNMSSGGDVSNLENLLLKEQTNSKRLCNYTKRPLSIMARGWSQGLMISL